jgi:hypothetical protein
VFLCVCIHLSAGGGGFATQTAGFLATAAAECARLTQLGEVVEEQMRSLCAWVGEAGGAGGTSSEEVLATLWSFAVQLDAAAVELRRRAAAAARRNQRKG